MGTWECYKTDAFCTCENECVYKPKTKPATAKTDVRAKAAAILTGYKLRQLEAVGLTVTDAKRLEALESLFRAERLYRSAQKESEYYFQVHRSVYPPLVQEAVKASMQVRKAIEELEAMERG